MSAKYKINEKVKVEHPKESFEGIVKASARYDKLFGKSGWDYEVERNDNGELYIVSESFIKSAE